jgi:hypothetical protein
MSSFPTDPIQIRMGGYGPPTTTHSRALKMIGDRLGAEFGDAVDIKYIWNVMDLGYKGEDVLWMVEHGILTLAYQSASYLTSRTTSLLRSRMRRQGRSTCAAPARVELPPWSEPCSPRALTPPCSRAWRQPGPPASRATPIAKDAPYSSTAFR